MVLERDIASDTRVGLRPLLCGRGVTYGDTECFVGMVFISLTYVFLILGDRAWAGSGYSA